MEEVPQGLLSQSFEELVPPPIPPKVIGPNEDDAPTSGVQNLQLTLLPLPPKQQ